MTNLTEKYKKGELKAGYYYVKNEFGNVFPTDYSEEYDSINDSGVLGFWNEVSEITEVIDKVPTYKEYQVLLSDQLAKNEGVEINAELKAENNKLKSRLDYITTASDYDIGRLQEDCHTLARKLLQVKPELREWLEVNFKEYL